MPYRPTSETSADPRVSDDQRDRAVQILTEHVASGRLAIDEFDARAARAYAAVSRSDLDEILRDLPAPARTTTPITPVRSRPPMSRELLTWASVGILCLSIWAVTSIATGNFLYPWPVWVIGPWGAMLALQRATGTSIGCANPGVRRG